MTLPARGTRQVEVAGSIFRWRVSVDDEVAFLYPQGGRVGPAPPLDSHRLIVEQPEFAGRTLTVAFDFAGREELGMPITPSLVCAVVAVANAKGWPAASASPLHLYWVGGRLMSHVEWTAARSGVGR